jgi:hypothetical protein
MLPLLSLLEDLVVAEFGNRDLNELRRHLASPDEEMSTALRARQLLESLALVQKKKPQQVYSWAGTRLIERLLKATPAITRGHTSVGTVLLQLNALIPRVIADQLPDSVCPEFWGDLMGGDVVRVGFDGDEEVAWVVEGAVRALAAHFGEEVEITRGFARQSLTERRLVDVRRVPKARTARPIRATPGLSSAGLRG